MKRSNISLGRCIAIYVGTRKLVAMLGDMRGKNPHILRSEEIFSPEGFSGGLISNLQNASASLEKLIAAILPQEEWSGTPFYVVLGNSHLKTYRFESCEHYSSGHHTITTKEVRRVIEQTRSVATLPLKESVLQIIPEAFLVNDMQSVRNPIGLEAERLGVTLQIHTMDFQNFKNISKVFDVLDLEIHGYFPKTLTVSEAVLTDPEKEGETVIFDIADDVTQLILWKNGVLVGTHAIKKGGHDLTLGLSKDLSISEHDAKIVKEKFATLDKDFKDCDELIPLACKNGGNNSSMRRVEFQEIFLKRAHIWMTDILKDTDDFFERERVHYPNYVFTGGAVSLGGFLEWLQQEFSRDGRLGTTRLIEASQEIVRDPSLAPALGMFSWITRCLRDFRPLFAPQNFIEKIIITVKQWFSKYF